MPNKLQRLVRRRRELRADDGSRAYEDADRAVGGQGRVRPVPELVPGGSHTLRAERLEGAEPQLHQPIAARDTPFRARGIETPSAS